MGVGGGGSRMGGNMASLGVGRRGHVGGGVNEGGDMSDETGSEDVLYQPWIGM